MIKLLKKKMVPAAAAAGGNLLGGGVWRAAALFAGDISCLETQNGLLRNVCLPHKIPPPLPEDSGATEGPLADNGFMGRKELCFFFLEGGGVSGRRSLELLYFQLFPPCFIQVI